MPLLLTLAGILCLVLLIAILKFDTFISFILVSIGLGLAAGLDADAIGEAIKTGVGGTLGELTLIRKTCSRKWCRSKNHGFTNSIIRKKVFTMGTRISGLHYRNTAFL
jgi:hypothetical protein